MGHVGRHQPQPRRTVMGIFRAWVGLGGALAVVLGLGATDAKAQKVLRVVPHADLNVLDGYQTTAAITGMHMIAVYDTLFSWDEKLEAKPQMLETYQVSPDNLKYTMVLRPGLKFHDGTPVTSKDV